MTTEKVAGEGGRTDAPDGSRRPTPQQGGHANTNNRTSVTRAPGRPECLCGHLAEEPCAYDTPAVDRYRARLGIEAVGRINPGTCRCQRACWVGSREQGNAKFICVCREGVMAS